MLGPVDGLHVRGVPRRRTPRSRRRSSRSSTWSAASSGLAAGHAAARRRLRLGRHGGARRRALRRRGARRHPLARGRPSGAARPCEDAGLSGPRRGALRRLPRREPSRGSTRSSSIGLTEHVGKAQLPGVLPLPARQAAPAWPAAQPLHHAPEQPAPAAAARRIHRPLRVPRRRAARARLPDLDGMHDAGFELRHEENLREHYARTLAAWGENLDATGTRRFGRWARPRRGSGGCTWPALACRSSRTTWISCTRCSAVRTEQGESGMPLRPDWGDRRGTLGGAAHVS